MIDCGSSVEVTDVFGNDLKVANAARVSFGKQSHEFTDKDEKLISYLAKHKHMSPFRQCAVTFRIKMPIFVMRQFVRHRIGVEINEISGRYAELPKDMYVPVEWRLQSTDNKQGSSGVIEDFDLAAELHQQYMDTLDVCWDMYQRLLSNGVAKEQARVVLPVATYTEIMVTMSLEAIAHFCKLREDGHAQFEIREIAHAMRDRTMKLFPVSFNALMES